MSILPEAAPHGLGLARGAGTGARSDMGKKHKKHKSDKHLYEGEEWGAASPRRLWAGERGGGEEGPRSLETTLELPRRAGTREGGAARRRPRRPQAGAAFEPQTPGPRRDSCREV